MIEKLDFLVKKHQELVMKIADPAVIADNKVWQKLMREHSELEPIVEKYQEYKSLKESLDENKEMLTDKSLEDDFREMVKEEIKDIEEQLPNLEQEIRTMLIPKDPNDDKNVIVEVRAGAGGDEAGLFAGDLFRMYTRYAERNRWKIELMSVSDNGVGGYKEVIFLIKGKGVYSRMKYESGTHRVQRVPATESAGRIHTSIATVAVLPEVDDVEVNIQANEVRCDVYRSSGNGGQSVNTTDSAVRLTHIPTGIVVAMQDEKSQLKNKAKAMRILKARIYEKQLEEQNKEIAQQRRLQVGTGDRSAKIRTYNFPQGRVSDHRITMTIHKLEAFLDGDINEILDALITSDNAEKLKQINR